MMLNKASRIKLYLSTKILLLSIFSNKDKSENFLIKKFRNIFKKIITVTIPNEPNAVNADTLRKICLKNKNKSEDASNIIEAIKKCSDSQEKIIVIFGSLYLIGDALNKN